MAESEQMSLDGILGGEERKKPEPAPAAEPVEKAEGAPPEVVKDPVEKQQVERNTSKRRQWADKEQDAKGRVRDPETGQFVPKEAKAEPEAKAAPAPEAKAAPEATKPAAPQQEFTDKEKAFLRAAQEERQKRQELERRLAALDAAKPQEPAKTFWDDPEGALKAHEDRVRMEGVQARLNMAEFTARQRHTDFDEKVSKFSELAANTPGLAQQMLAAPDPAEFAYTTAKNHIELQQVGGIEEMKAKIERETAARVRAQVEQELRAKADELAKARAALPQSLSDARSTGPAHRPAWGGPTPLDNILKG